MAASLLPAASDLAQQSWRRVSRLFSASEVEVSAWAKGVTRLCWCSVADGAHANAPGVWSFDPAVPSCGPCPISSLPTDQQRLARCSRRCSCGSGNRRSACAACAGRPAGADRRQRDAGGRSSQRGCLPCAQVRAALGPQQGAAAGRWAGHSRVGWSGVMCLRFGMGGLPWTSAWVRQLAWRPCISGMT